MKPKVTFIVRVTNLANSFRNVYIAFYNRHLEISKY